MHKNNFYISFGVWIAVLPFLGIPGAWRNALIFISGIFLVLISLGPVILKKLQVKTKLKKKPSTTNAINFQETSFQNNEQNEELRFSAPENDKTEVGAEKEI